MHMNIHIGEKRHKCAQCINSFNQPGDLERHLLSEQCSLILGISRTVVYNAVNPSIELIS